jgi:thioredoxin-related protein
MKKVILLSFIAFIAGTVLAQNIQSIAIGSSIPVKDLKMKDISGKEVSIKDVMGKNGVLVMFSCNTCSYVIKNQERTRQINGYALQNNIGVIVINSNEAQRSGEDSYAAMQAYAKAQAYKWHYTADDHSKIADAFGASRTPEVFLFDAAGKLVYKGAIDDNPANAGNVKREHLKEAIQEMKSGKNVSITESRSVGCSIKSSGSE